MGKGLMWLWIVDLNCVVGYPSDRFEVASEL